MTKNDFLKPLLDLMNRRMDGFEKKIDDNTLLTQQALDSIKSIDGTVDGHAKDIHTLKNALAKLERKHGKKLDVSPNVIYLIAIGAVILLLIVAQLLHVNLGGLIK